MARKFTLTYSDILNALNFEDIRLKLLPKNLYQPFNANELDNLETAQIKKANDLLNRTATHHNGLGILLEILQLCSKDTLTKYATLWISKATQVLENTSNRVVTLTLACQVLAKLLTMCKEIPDVHKQISMQNVKQCVTIIANYPADKRIGGMFYLLARLLNEYKEACEKQQTTIRKIVLQAVDSDKPNIVQGGANCFALLSRATERSFKPPSSKPNCTNDIYHQTLICNSLHGIMEEIFSDIVELENDDSGEKLELNNICEDDVTKYYFILEKRFAALCIYLNTILYGCGGKNSVSPMDILKLLCRGLAVKPSSLAHDDSDKKKIISLIIPNLHVYLLTVLNTFIDAFNLDLIVDASTILKLYTQTLKWTDNIPENHRTLSGHKSFTNVRISVYKSISIWLTRLKDSSYIDLIAEEIISQYIFKDIVPEKDRLLLTIQKPQNLSKRALKRHEDTQYENSTVLKNTTEFTKDPLLNAELCCEALKALENIFTNSRTSLKTSLYEATQGLIVSLLWDVYRGVDINSFYKKKSHCRFALLRVLHTIQLNHHPLLSPPTNYSIDICYFALRDPETEISREARVFLSHLESIVHPSAATLQFSASIIQEDNQQQREIETDEMPEVISNVSVERVRKLFRSVDLPKTKTKASRSDREDDEEPESKKQRKSNIDEPKSSEINSLTQSKANKPKIIEDTIISNGEKDQSKDQSSLKANSNGTSSIYPLTQRIIAQQTQGKCSATLEDENNTTADTKKEFNNHISSAKSDTPLIEDDSGDEAILNLFCDELK